MPSAGQLIRASDILDRRGCRVRRAANQSINSGAATSISWDTSDEDTDVFITVTGTTVTIPTGLGGIYAMTARVTGSYGESGGIRDFLSFEVTSAITGMPVSHRSAEEGAAEDQMEHCVVIPLLAGDSFVVQVFHQHGSAVNFTAWLSCYRVGL